MNASMSPAQPVDSDDDESALPMFWLSLFASILIVGLLFAFQQIVHAAVNQADSKRISDTASADAAWRCRAVARGAETLACATTLVGARP